MAIDKNKTMVVPDAIHHTDTSETLEYISGWNDCRQAMLADQPAQQEPFGYFKAEPFGWTECAETDEGAVALYTTPQAQREPLTDEQIDLLINGRGEEDDDDYVEPTGDGFGLTDADLVRLVRRVEAAHNIKENT